MGSFQLREDLLLDCVAIELLDTATINPNVAKTWGADFFVWSAVGSELASATPLFAPSTCQSGVAVRFDRLTASLRDSACPAPRRSLWCGAAALHGAMCACDMECGGRVCTFHGS